MLTVLKSDNPFQSMVIADTIASLVLLSDRLKSYGEDTYVREEDRAELLDALCDQIVTATGIGTFFGMNVPGALSEVNHSNYSKFVDGNPIFNENQKVMKGPDYTPPVLTPFI